MTEKPSAGLQNTVPSTGCTGRASYVTGVLQAFEKADNACYNSVAAKGEAKENTVLFKRFPGKPHHSRLLFVPLSVE